MSMTRDEQVAQFKETVQFEAQFAAKTVLPPDPVAVRPPPPIFLSIAVPLTDANERTIGHKVADDVQSTHVKDDGPRPRSRQKAECVQPVAPQKSAHEDVSWADGGHYPFPGGVNRQRTASATAGNRCPPT